MPIEAKELREKIKSLDTCAVQASNNTPFEAIQ